MSIWQFKLLGGLNFCQFEVPTLVLFVYSTSCHWGLFGKGWGPVWSTYLTHPNLCKYRFIFSSYPGATSLCQQLTLVVLSFPVFCGNWHRFCSKWRSGSLMTFPLFFASHSRISSPGPSEPKVYWGRNRPPSTDFGMNRSKFFSLERPHITTRPLGFSNLPMAMLSSE